MTKRELKKYPNGLYKVFWKSGGFSLAAVGTMYDGTRWLAPTNWTDSCDYFKAPTLYWRHVEKIEKIYPFTNRSYDA